MLDNLEKNLSLEDIAQSVYLSPHYFSGIFKAQEGQTVMDFITEKRVALAQSILIAEPSLQINALAERMGYNSAQSFIRQFKRVTGFTPEQYRKDRAAKF